MSTPDPIVPPTPVIVPPTPVQVLDVTLNAPDPGRLPAKGRKPPSNFQDRSTDPARHSRSDCPPRHPLIVADGYRRSRNPGRSRRLASALRKAAPQGNSNTPAEPAEPPPNRHPPSPRPSAKAPPIAPRISPPCAKKESLSQDFFLPTPLAIPLKSVHVTFMPAETPLTPETLLTPGTASIAAQFAAIIDALCAIIEDMAGDKPLIWRLARLTQNQLRRTATQFAALVAAATAGALRKPAPPPLPGHSQAERAQAERAQPDWAQPDWAQADRALPESEPAPRPGWLARLFSFANLGRPPAAEAPCTVPPAPRPATQPRAALPAPARAKPSRPTRADAPPPAAGPSSVQRPMPPDSAPSPAPIPAPTPTSRPAPIRRPRQPNARPLTHASPRAPPDRCRKTASIVRRPRMPISLRYRINFLDRRPLRPAPEEHDGPPANHDHPKREHGRQRIERIQHRRGHMTMRPRWPRCRFSAAAIFDTDP